MNPQVARQFGRYSDPVEVLRLSGRRQIETGEFEPSEYIEACGALIVDLQVGEREGAVRVWSVEVRAVQRDKTLSMLILQRLQQDAIDDRVYRYGRTGANGKRHDR